MTKTDYKLPHKYTIINVINIKKARRNLIKLSALPVGALEIVQAIAETS